MLTRPSLRRKNQIFFVSSKFGPFKGCSYRGLSKKISLEVLQALEELKETTAFHRRKRKVFLDPNPPQFLMLDLFKLDTWKKSCPIQVTEEKALNMLSRAIKKAGEKSGPCLASGLQPEAVEKKGIAHLIGHHKNENQEQVSHGDNSGKNHPQWFTQTCGKKTCDNLVCDRFQDACAKMAAAANPYYTHRGNLTHARKVLDKETIPLSNPDTQAVLEKKKTEVFSEEVELREKVTQEGFRNGDHHLMQSKIQEKDDEN